MTSTTYGLQRAARLAASGAMLLNSWPRAAYAEAMKSCGIKTAGLTKVELFKLVRATPAALAFLRQRAAEVRAATEPLSQEELERMAKVR